MIERPIGKRDLLEAVILNGTPDDKGAWTAKVLEVYGLLRKDGFSDGEIRLELAHGIAIDWCTDADYEKGIDQWTITLDGETARRDFPHLVDIRIAGLVRGDR